MDNYYSIKHLKRISIFNNEQFYMDNYSLLQVPTSKVCVNYSYLIRETNQIPSDYFTKFCNLQEVKSEDEIKNGKQFLWFLRNSNDFFDVGFD
jgi:hypothetical protein